MITSKNTVVYILILFVSINRIYSQSSSLAERYILLADGYKKDKKPDSAIIYYEKASVEFKLVGNNEKFIDAYNQIGVVLTRQDKYEEAKFYLEKALSAGLATLDSNSLVIARTYIGLGVLYGAEDQFERSLIYHNKALAIRFMRSGMFDADVATSYGNIGNIYFRNKDYDRSIEAHLKAMEIREKIFGKESNEVVQSYTNLGNAYNEKKSYQEALGYYERALNNKIAQLGQRHIELVKYYRNMSELCYLMHNKLKGDEYKMKSEEIEKPSK